MKDDTRFMARAIQLAKRGWYSTHPNPAVGCVYTRQGEVIGEGYHIKAGSHHAEINALHAAGGDVSGATAYVTLEPCSFVGRTPSCAKTMVEQGVARVNIAMLDPDPRNAGRGVQILRDAGIPVDIGLLQDEAAGLIKGHVKRYQGLKPYTRLKLAMSLDGKTALANGESKWITGAAARLDVQKLRARSAAIVTGVQTVIDDDPSLRVRGENLELPHLPEALGVMRPIYVLDSSGRVPTDRKILSQPETVLVTGRGVLIPGEVSQLELDTDHQGIMLGPFLNELAQREHSEVLIECGATLGGAFLREGLIDEVVLYVAPSFMGAGARSLLNLPEIDRMSDLVKLDLIDVRQIGEDLRLTLHPKQTME